jgi:acetyl esterase/lipase
MICEKIDLYGDHRVMLYTYIHRWTTVPGHFPKRGGVVVLPGGAYMVHGNSEGEPVAEAFAAAGYNAYVLKYSLGDHAVFPNSAADVCRALKLIRSRAGEFFQDPDKLALCGFSAGGHVAACVGTMWNRADLLAASGCTGEEGRPNALILGYPCITVDVEGQGDMYWTLAGSRSLEELRQIASAEDWVGPHTPPTFLWNIYGDKLVPVEHGLKFQAALAQANIPYSSHTYMNGSHGCALATPATSLGNQELENPQVARWFQDCVLWLREIFDVPQLDVPQENLPSLSQDRAHLGVPAFRFEK